MRGSPADLSHDTLLRSVASAKSEAEREALLAEVRRRLERAPEPRALSTPWHPENGGC